MVNPLLAPLQASTLTFPNSQNVKSHDHHLTKYVSFPHFQKKIYAISAKSPTFLPKYGEVIPVACLFLVCFFLHQTTFTPPLAPSVSTVGQAPHGSREAPRRQGAAQALEGLKGMQMEGGRQPCLGVCLGNVHWWGGILEV